MNENDLKKMMVEMKLENNNLSDEDFSKLTNAINGSSSINEACKKICEVFPELSEEELKEATDLIISNLNQKQQEEVTNLSENDLEAVAGGSFGSWMKKNWGYVVGGVGLFAASWLIGKRIGSYKANNAYQAAEDTAYKEAFNLAEGKGKMDGFIATMQTNNMENVVGWFDRQVGWGLKG
ncbi:hypothetical protein MSI_05450 [Treponema sp. JC4]|uniref:hypothetical protein n=1 Tax=Treponema sp. JC4 TaxID=1124982 RepID=UPI00025B0A16|nr:hypothetical protein [Treponema sp. JC4]EID85726.1 hypothetical protein MSI_05450 [Treponema sp. JC4]